MKLIVALGNIGDKYLYTRHNAGFMVVDLMSLNFNFSYKEDSKLKCFFAKTKINNSDVLIIKPTTYMNLSGESLSLVKNYYKVNNEDILIVHDDISIELGRLRFRANGSDGGHNGIKSVIQHLGTNKFDRLKIGIGPQPPIPSESFVLQKFSHEQEFILKESLKNAVDAICFYLDNGIEKAQNKYN
ncbi:aminoacyl-tRNA hydrolase [bacterium]|nr:aminoacyl-tRNA hydrolase [bacterium]